MNRIHDAGKTFQKCCRTSSLLSFAHGPLGGTAHSQGTESEAGNWSGEEEGFFTERLLGAGWGPGWEEPARGGVVLGMAESRRWDPGDL